MQATRNCSIDGCTRPWAKREWCSTHYARWRRTGDPLAVRSKVHAWFPCAVDGCTVLTGSRNPLCRAHQRAADTDGPHGLPIYFADKIAFGADDQCWPWLKHVNSAGYGYVSWLGKVQPAHRVVYRLLVGDFDPELQIDHVRTRGCTTRLCCNPAHLEAVTPAENKRRATMIDADLGRTGCKRGHDWEQYPPQIVRRSDGTVSRTCAECERQRQRARTAASR